MLWKPPPEMKREKIAELPQWDTDLMGADFMAQLSARGGGGRTSG